MKQNSILDRLASIRYFENTYQLTPPALANVSVVEKSCPKCFAYIRGGFSENALFNARNDLGGWLSLNARERYRKWNSVVHDAKSPLISIIRDHIRPRFPPRVWNNHVEHYFYSILLGIVLADHFSDLSNDDPPFVFYEQLLNLLEGGFFPVGWRFEGNWPKGKFILGPIPTDADLENHSTLSTDQMIIEGRRLARPSWQLKGSPIGTPVAVWKLPCKDDEHWITVNWDHFPLFHGGVRGCTVVVQTGVTSFFVRDMPGEKLNNNGTLLYAHESNPLPPLYVLLQESEIIQQWLLLAGEAEFTEKCEVYASKYQDECPVFQQDDDLYAVISGWPIELYEGD